MTKEILLQYTDLVKEAKEIRHRMSNLEREIEKLENRCTDDVSIVVKGQFGNNVTIQGSSEEMQRAKTELLVKKMILSQRAALLHTLEFEILEQTNDVECYIATIDNSYMRRLVSFRVIDGLRWEEISVKMGGGNTIDSVKKAFYRYIK